MAVTVLPFVQTVITRYIVSTYFALGLIGNICNFIVFMKQSRQRTSCSIYLLSLSIFAFIYLTWSVVPPLYTLNHIDPQTQLLVYCKLRLYGSHVIGQFVRFSVVFACADRFFLTRTSARIRSWSSVQTARKIIPINCVIWTVGGLQIIFFNEIRGGVCGMFGLNKLIYAIYQSISVGILPPVLMSVFGYLTVRSLRQRHAANEHIRQKDNDLMRMLVAEIMINIFTSIPFSAYLLYGAVTINVVGKSAERIEIEAFINYMTQLLIHMLSVAPFYLFLIASKTFRGEFTQIMVGWWYKYNLRCARVAPITGQTTAITLQNKETLNPNPRDTVQKTTKESCL